MYQIINMSLTKYNVLSLLNKHSICLNYLLLATCTYNVRPGTRQALKERHIKPQIQYQGYNFHVTNHFYTMLKDADPVSGCPNNWTKRYCMPST